MDTIIYKIDSENIDRNLIGKAAEVIREGGMVAFPTETVYGLGADGLREDAAKKIYEAKGRPSDNPLILHISDIEQLDDIALEVNETARKLMEAFWPGPLTLIFKKKPNIPDGVTGGLDTVAVRMPVHPIALALIDEAKVPIAAPSANISGRPSPTKAEHVIEDFEGRIQMIIDGGRVEIGLESTILDVTGDIPMILRPGFITDEMVKVVVGDVTYDKVVKCKDVSTLGEGYKPKAPGMKYRHYAPKAEFTMYEGAPQDVVNRINAEATCKIEEGHKVIILATKENASLYTDKAEVIILGSRADVREIATNIYDALRECDTRRAEYIFGEAFDNTGLGQAVMNRLMKAAGYRMESV